DGPPAGAQQPHGPDVGGQGDQPAGARLLGPGRGPCRLQRVQPARLADDVGQPPHRRPGRTHPPTRAGAVSAYAPSLPFDDPRPLAAHRFMVEEAAILDAGEWSRWLDLLTADVRYVMPVRVTTVNDTGYDDRIDMAHFDEDRYAIEKRVHRLSTDHAWTED